MNQIIETFPKSTQQYSIKLSKQDFKFNCAHFLCEENEREYLHGHNYQTSIEIKCIKMKNESANNGFVADFREIKPIMRKICKQLDGHTIIPTQSPTMPVIDLDENHIKLEFDNQQFVFPKKDCVFIDVKISTCEEIAQYLLKKFLTELPENFIKQKNVSSLTFSVQESPGQKAKIKLKL